MELARVSLGSGSERHAGGLAVGGAGPGSGGRLGGRRTPGREGHTRTERRVPQPPSLPEIGKYQQPEDVNDVDAHSAIDSIRNEMCRYISTSNKTI